MIFAYFGPETLLPLTSVVAGVAGVILMFGRNSLRFLGLGLRAAGRKVGIGRRAGADASRPAAGRAHYLRNRKPADAAEGRGH